MATTNLTLLRSTILEILREESPMTANQIAEILGEDKVRILGELRRFRKLGTVDESDDVPHYLSDVDRADRQSFEFAGTRAEVRLG